MLTESLIAILLSFIASVIFTIGGWLWWQAFNHLQPIIPGKYKEKGLDFSSLSDFELEYRIIQGASNECYWQQSRIEDLRIRNSNRVTGKHVRLEENGQCCSFQVQGEIRAGNMVLIESCIADPSRYFTAIYSEVSSKKRILGVYQAYEEQKLCSGFSVLTKKDDFPQLEELNILAEQSGFSQRIKLSELPTEIKHFWK